MNQLATIIYAPNLYLFAFQLATGLDGKWQPREGDREWLSENYHLIISKFPGFETQFKQKYKLRENDEQQGIYGNLLDTEKYPKGKLWLKQSEIPEVAGIYPQQIADTYALMLILYKIQAEGKDEVKTSELAKFNPENCLDLKGNIGKTLLFYAFVKEEEKQDFQELKKLADECLNNILPKESQPPFLKSDRLFQSKIFVYSNPKEEKQEDKGQVLIIFFTKEENNEKFLKAYNSTLQELLLEYHKIVKAYQQGKKQYTIANEQIGEIGKIINELDELEQKEGEINLEKLKKKLKELLKINVEYFQIIAKIERQINTIEINLYSYERDLENLQKETEDNLDYFVYLKERVLPSLQKELQINQSYATEGLLLIEKAVATIRGLIEIDQAESDRRLQELKEREVEEKAESDRQLQELKEKSDRQLQITIAGVGTGIAVGGIVASSSGQITQDNPITWLPKIGVEVHSFFWIVLFSIFCGVVASIPAMLIVKTLGKNNNYTTMRIYGNRELKTLPGRETRPTSARVREALFNIWQGKITNSKWLDLCAGNGSIGAEALCRGAKKVIGIEQSGRACGIIKENWRKVAKSEQEFKILRGDVLVKLKSLEDSEFDYIYFDPPYASELYQPVLEIIANKNILAEGGEIAVEHNPSLRQNKEIPGLTIIREKVYGNSALTFYKRQ